MLGPCCGEVDDEMVQRHSAYGDLRAVKRIVSSREAGSESRCSPAKTIFWISAVIADEMNPFGKYPAKLEYWNTL